MQRYPKYDIDNFAYTRGNLCTPLPFRFKEALYFCFLIRVDETHLRRICDRNFNIPTDYELEFSPLFPFVMMVFAYYPVSYTGDWAKEGERLQYQPYREFFYVVMMRKRGNYCLDFLKAYGYVPMLFLDQKIPVVAGREVFGMPKTMASLEYAVPLADGKKLFRCKAVTYGKYGSPAAAREETLVEVICPSSLNIEKLQSKNEGDANRYLHMAMHDKLRKVENLDIGASQLISNFNLLNFVSFRQYRDVFSGNKALYQSVIQFQNKNLMLHRAEMLEGNYEIRFPYEDSRNSLFPIRTDLGQEKIVKPEASFWMEFSFDLEEAEDIWRPETGVKNRLGFWRKS